mmetsp:Transcript_62523/g.116235  ORF Transcript_62523/g.116235 Transcript_62523/m.116235 type:complete len:335 (-) Transcript_62523:77-1081(-)
MAKQRLPAWSQPRDPGDLDEPRFQEWLRRQHRHQQLLESSTGCIDVIQYEREVDALSQLMSTSARTRKFKQNEKQADMHRGNMKLVQKLCEMAEQSEKRQANLHSQILSENQVVKEVGGARQRQRQQKTIEAENKALHSRLETTKSMIPSVAQTAQAYRCHTAMLLRLRRIRQTPNDIARRLAQPPKSAREPVGRPRPPLWQHRGAAARPETAPEAATAAGNDQKAALQPQPPAADRQRPHTVGPLSARTTRQLSGTAKPPAGRESPAKLLQEGAPPAPASEEAQAPGKPDEEGKSEGYSSSDFEEDFEEDSSSSSDESEAADARSVESARDLD